MTVPATSRRAGPFTGTGVLTSYPFTFRVFENADVAVTTADTDDVETEGVLDSTFLVTMNVDQDTTPGGSVQYAVGGVAAALPTGYTLAITGATAYTQETGLPQGGNFNAAVVEQALDKLAIQIQQIRDEVVRSVRLTVLSPLATDATLPIPTGSAILGWNADGTALQNYTPDTTVSTDALRSDLLSAFIGASIVGFQGAAPGSGVRQSMNKMRERISVRDVSEALGGGVADDTATIQALLTACGQASVAPESTTGEYDVVFTKGCYLVSSLDVPARVHLSFEGGYLKPIDVVTARTHLIKFSGGHCRVNNLTIDANYATNYDTMVWVRSRHNTFNDPEIWRPKVAWIFGDPAWEGVAANGHLGDSENLVIGGKVIWAITVAKFYGQNTIVNFDGHLGYSFKASLPGGDPRKAAWEAQTEIGYVNCGAAVFFNGTTLANFAGTAPLLQSRLQEASAVGYDNRFGNFVLNGVQLETGFILEVAATGATVEDTTSSLLSMTGCNGYISSGRVGNIIEAGTSKQSIHVDGSCKFYGNTVNTVCAAGADARVHIDPQAFGGLSIDFFQALSAARLVGYPSLLVLNANTSNTAMTGTKAALKPTTLNTCDLATSIAAAAYNSGTGVFTAPTDMREVEVIVSMVFTGGVAADENDVFLSVNGVQVEVRVAYGLRPTVRFRIRRLARNDTVLVEVASIPSRTLSNTADTFIKIVGTC